MNDGMNNTVSRVDNIQTIDCSPFIITTSTIETNDTYWQPD